MDKRGFQKILVAGGVGLAGMALLGGCATSNLWDDTHPRQSIWIDAKDITEAELQKRGVEYEVYTSETCNGFLVEKSAKDKFKDYHLRLLGTPVTLAVDAATTVAVGAVFLLSYSPETCELLIHACTEL